MKTVGRRYAFAPVGSGDSREVSPEFGRSGVYASASEAGAAPALNRD
jgi:hypothetical protein